MLVNDQPTTPPVVKKGHGLPFRIAALALVLVSGLCGLGLSRLLKKVEPVAVVPPDVVDKPGTALKLPPHLFQGWTRPDFVIVLSGQQYGYLLPCGCSRPQKGGLERRYNLIQLLEKRGWPVVSVDLGDVPQT